MHQAQQAAMRNILRPDEVQAKSDIGELDGKYDQEADHVADAGAAGSRKKRKNFFKSKKYQGKILKPHHILNLVSMPSGVAASLWQNLSEAFSSRGLIMISARCDYILILGRLSWCGR